MATPHAAMPPGSADPKQPRTWNGGTWAVLAAGVVVVLLAGVAIVVASVQAQARDTGEAAAVAEEFIASATAADDDAWREVSSNRLRSTSLDRSPLRLDEATMAALDAEMSAESGELRFVRSAQADALVDESQADTAFLTVDLEYSITTFGRDFTFAIPQQVWLTRPFYYGDDVADRADADRAPTAIGPWRVTAISSPQHSAANPGMGQTPARTDLATTERGGGSECTSVGGVFTQLSDSARTGGELRSGCWLRDDGSSVIGDDVDLALLAAEFPLFDTSHVPE